MTDLSKRMRELHAHKDDEDDGPPIDIGCGVAGRDFYKACDESVPAICAEIEALEQKHDSTDWVSREMLKAVARALADAGIVEGIVIESMTLVDVVKFVCDGIKKLETELAYERDARRFKVFELIPGDWVWTESDGCINGAWPTMRAAVDAARKAGVK